MRYIITLTLLLFFVSCGSSRLELHDTNTFKIEEYSNDPSYGYTKDNPIKVGGASDGVGPLNERRFLNALAGPNGEEISYERLGSTSTGRNEFTRVILDMYKITYEGLDKEIILYINMYQSSKLKVPVGFKLKY